MVEQDSHAAGTLRFRLSWSGTHSTRRRSTPRIQCGICPTVAPSPRFPNGAAAGARVPRNTDAPLTLSESRPMTERTLLPACRRIPSSSAPDASLPMQERPPPLLCLAALTPLSGRCRRAAIVRIEGLVGMGWNRRVPGAAGSRRKFHALPQEYSDHRPRNRCDSPRHCVALGLETVQPVIPLGSVSTGIENGTRSPRPVEGSEAGACPLRFETGKSMWRVGGALMYHRPAIQTTGTTSGSCSASRALAVACTRQTTAARATVGLAVPAECRQRPHSFQGCHPVFHMLTAGQSRIHLTKALMECHPRSASVASIQGKPVPSEFSQRTSVGAHDPSD